MHLAIAGVPFAVGCLLGAIAAAAWERPGGAARVARFFDFISGLERLVADGWTEVWSGSRMIRGQPLDWTPTAIWSQFNHAIG